MGLSEQAKTEFVVECVRNFLSMVGWVPKVTFLRSVSTAGAGVGAEELPVAGNPMHVCSMFHLFPRWLHNFSYTISKKHLFMLLAAVTAVGKFETIPKHQFFVILEAE